MIYLVRGTILEKGEGYAVVDTGSVAYELGISMTTYAALPDKGGDAELYTHFSMTENGVHFYGFATMEEKKLFLQLITVSKIGPKSAQSILSGISPNRLKAAVVGGDAGLLATVPGIGKKTAERIIVELKDKFDFDDAIIDETGEVLAEVPAEAGFDDAVSGLMNFGYQKAEAQKAVKKIYKTGMGFDEIFRLALKALSS